MFCENCGSKLPDGAKFCGGCGAKTEPAAPAYEAPVQPATRPAQPAAAYATQQNCAPQQPSYATPIHNTGTAPLRVGQYVGMLLLMCVPLLNIILLFMWSFGRSVNLNKKNFAKASLILCAVSLIFFIIGGGAIMGALSEIMGGFY